MKLLKLEPLHYNDKFTKLKTTFCTLKAATDSATGLKFVATALPQVPKIFSTEADCSGGLIKIEIRGFKEVGGVEIEEKKGSIKTGTYRRFTKD